MEAKRKWTAREEKIIRELYPTTDVLVIAKKLNRSVQAIMRRAWDLQIHKARNTWTKEDDNYIKKHYPNTPTKKIAEHLKRSITAINIRAFDLNVKKNVEYLRAAKKSYLLPKNIVFGPCRFKVLNSKGYWEEWTGSFPDVEDAKRWYELHGKFHELRGKKLKLFELKSGREVTI